MDGIWEGYMLCLMDFGGCDCVNWWVGSEVLNTEPSNSNP